MALYIPHSIFHLARLLYVTPETSGPYYVHVQLTCEINQISIKPFNVISVCVEGECQQLVPSAQQLSSKSCHYVT